MTAVTLDSGAGAQAVVAPWGQRVLSVVRVHVANPWPTLITPWIIFLAVFALNLGIWIAVVEAAGGRDQLDTDAFSTNGAVTWIYVFLLVAAVQAMNLTFAFILGLGVTRRDYFAGTVVYFVGLSLFFAAGITALAAVERATDGWGLEGYVFSPWFLNDLPLGEQFVFHLLIALLFYAIGSVAGAMWLRWKVIGLYTMFGLLALLIVVGAFAASAFEWWGAIGRFFTDRPVVEVVAWTLPLTLASGIGTYALLRRATPRS